MILNVVEALINVVHYLSELFTRRRECWILKALRQVLSLCEVFETEPDIVANLIQPGLLLNQILTGRVQRRCFRIDEVVFLRQFI